MMRLIDADALIEYTNNQILRSIDSNDIARFPTVDAVPVVHCAECEHRKIGGTSPFMYTYCSHERGLREAVKDTDFCPYGERRSDDEILKPVSEV